MADPDDHDVNIDMLEGLVGTSSYYGIDRADYHVWAHAISDGIWSLPRTWTLRSFEETCLPGSIPNLLAENVRSHLVLMDE